MKDIKELITERAKTHGDFTNTAEVAQRLKSDLGYGPSNWGRLPNIQREALENIQQKVARILTGDPDHRDAWQDIQGYCQLVLDRITPSQDELMHETVEEIDARTRSRVTEQEELIAPMYCLYHGKETTVISFQTPDRNAALRQAIFESLLASGHWVVLRWYDGRHSHREEYLYGNLEKEWHDVQS